MACDSNRSRCGRSSTPRPRRPLRYRWCRATVPAASSGWHAGTSAGTRWGVQGSAPLPARRGTSSAPPSTSRRTVSTRQGSCPRSRPTGGVSRCPTAIRGTSRSTAVTDERGGDRARIVPDVDEPTLTAVIEIPGGSRNKYELDPATGQIFLDRMLFTATRYPADYGFIEGTLGGDGDALDALVFVGEPTFPGCRIEVRAVGMFVMRDEKGMDEKILCVPLRDPAWSHVKELSDLLPTLRAEIEHFFSVYKDLEDARTETDGFRDRDAALVTIREARDRLASQP